MADESHPPTVPGDPEKAQPEGTVRDTESGGAPALGDSSEDPHEAGEALADPDMDEATAITGESDDVAEAVADDAPVVETEAEDEAADPVSAQIEHGWFYALLLVFVLALGFGAWGLWQVLRAAPLPGGPGEVVTSGEAERLRQQVATLTRSDEISRTANAELQRTLAARDEEIAGLRADVAFYERFVGATGQRRGLSVHDLHMEPANESAWHFTATLTQSLVRDADVRGRLTLSVEGTQDGKLRKLDWPALRGEGNAAPREFAFKFFQQVEGDIVLPAGFEPVRVQVKLVPQGGRAVEQGFAWSDAIDRPAVDEPVAEPSAEAPAAG